MTTKKLIRSLVLAGASVLTASSARGQIVYHEKFDHYGFAMPGFTNSCVMAEWPPSLKHLEFRPTKQDSVYQGGFFHLPPEAQGLTDYEFEFRLRFSKDAPKACDFRLECLLDDGGKQPKYSSCTIKISDDWSGVAGVGNFQPRLPATRTPMKDTAFRPLLGGYFYRCLVRVQGQQLEAFIEGLGQTARIGASEVHGDPLAGFNFSGASAFDLDDITVRKISGLPAGDFRAQTGAQVANHAAEYKLPIPADANTASAQVRLGHPGEMRIHLQWADGSTTPLAVSTFSSSMEKPVVKEQPSVQDGQTVVERKQLKEPWTLPDAGLNFREINEKRSPHDWHLALKLAISGEPCYVLAPAEARTVTVGQRAYPEDQVPVGAKTQVADRMDLLDRWQMIDKADNRLENVPQLGNKNYLPFRQFGKYELRVVTDEQRGKCLELELLQEGQLVPFLAEYTVLKLKAPVLMQGTPTTLGIWVKGNSGWGQLMWELEDAAGEKWLSCGTGGYGCDIYDWPKQAAINFDGWNFLQFPLVQASPVRLPNPGEVAQQWLTSGGGNGRIDFPIKLTGVVVTMTRQALNLTAMEPVRTVVRLSGLSAYGE